MPETPLAPTRRRQRGKRRQSASRGREHHDLRRRPGGARPRADDAAAHAPRRGPYETAYEISHGYPDGRPIEVR